MPTLVVWGEYDRVTSRQTAEELRDAIPGARLVIIPGAGHVSNQEQPTLFNTAVREFLANAQVETSSQGRASKAP